VNAAIYARVSTTDQTCDNQLLELRRYCAARGWQPVEYVDTGVSGAKDRRLALDRLMADARQRKVDTVVVWRLDRFGRNLRHLITAIEELNAAAVSFVSMGENIDTASPTGRLLLGIMGSFAEFERERIRERIHAGLARARRQGQKLGRKRERIAVRHLQRVAGLSVREASKVLGVPASRVHSERLRVFGNGVRQGEQISEETAASSPRE
jgi:DNA invertase Pin-like site-specific DNA recombinase